MGQDPFADLDPAAPALSAPSPTTQAAPSKDPFADLDAPRQSNNAGQALPAPSLMTAAAQPFAGFNDALASTVGAPWDLGNWGERKLGFQGSDEPIMGSRWIKDKLLGSIGANPDTLPAQTALERILRGAGAGAAGVLLPEAALAGGVGAGAATVAPRTVEALQGAFGSAASAPAVVGNAAIGAMSGAGGQAAEEVAPDKYKGYANLAGSLIGGGIGVGAAAVPLGVRAGVDAAKGYAAPMTRAGQEAIAGDTLAKAASDPSAVRSALEDPPAPLVPGSSPTTFQMTGDMGLGSLERSVATQNPELFQARRADQNAARSDALTAIQPQGDPMDVAKSLRSQLDALDAQNGQAVMSRTADAQNAVSALGGSNSPDFYGAQIRSQIVPQIDAATDQASGAVRALGGDGSAAGYGGAMRDAASDAKNTANRARRSAYDAIDPNGTLNMVGQPVKDAVADLRSGLSPLAQQPAGEEAAIHGAIAGMPDVVPFNSIRALDSRVTAAMAAERATAGETPVWGRLSQLKSAVSGAIDNGVANQVAYERRAVGLGAFPAENTLESRLNQWTDQFDRGSVGPHSVDAAYGTSDARPNAAPGLLGAESEARGGSGDSSGGSGVSDAPVYDPQGRMSRPAAPVTPRPQNLNDFIRSHGGMQDPGGDLRSMGLGDVRGLIAKPGQGLHPDKMREAAAEAGYLGGDTAHAVANTTINDLLDHVAAPGPVHSVHDADATHAWDIYDHQRAEYAKQDTTGGRAAPAQRVPLSAYRQEDAYPAGMAPADLRSGEPKPNFDQAAADRLATAKQIHAAFAQTFKQGPVGQMLKTNGFGGQYRLLDGGVPDTVFVRGNKGAETVRAYLAAVGDNQAAHDALQNFAAMSLRRAAERPDGTLDPARFAGWMGAHREAMSALPDLRTRFSTARAAQDALQRFAPFSRDAAPSAVPEAFFHSGPSGGDGVSNLRQLIGDRSAEHVLTDYAASRLKAAAMRPDGTLDPAKVAQFQKTHAQALDALPGLSDRFGTVAKASKAIEDAALARKQALDEFQQGAVGKVLGVSEPADVVKTIGSVFGQKNAASDMKALAARAANNPDAKQGLRKAVADYMLGKLTSNTEAAASGRNLLKSDQFQSFVQQNQAALRQVFDAKEISSLQAIAADLNRANRSVSAVRLPGQSNTAQDLAAVAKHDEHGHGTSLMTKVLVAGGAGLTHGLEAAITGAAGALGTHVVGGMRQAGMTKVSDLVRDAMLNPELAKALLAKAPVKVGRGSEVSLAHQLRRVAMLSAASSAASSP